MKGFSALLVILVAILGGFMLAQYLNGNFVLPQVDIQQPAQFTIEPLPVVEVTATTEQPTPEVRTITIVVTAVPLPTYTPMPTYTPAPLIDAHGLPMVGPYTLEQVGLCKTIISNGQINNLPSPQRELCEAYAEN